MKHSVLYCFISKMKLLKPNLLIRAGFMVMLFLSTNVYAADWPWSDDELADQPNRITGTIVDKDGAPLPGATITVLGTTRGVITDMDGTFSIDAAPTDKLVFSFIGMESQVLDVDNKTKIDVVLLEKTEELDDVTVVAYAKQKKESISIISVLLLLIGY